MIRFREITVEAPEYERAKQLRHDVLRVPLGLVLTEHDTEHDDEQYHFVALDGTTLLGNVTMRPLSKETVKLRQMAIVTGMQGKGIGQQLIEHAEKVMHSLGYREAVTDARIVAQNFYSRMGYVQEGMPFTEVTIPHIRMRKAL